MKASEKFYKRLDTLGLLVAWSNQGAFGRIATETKDGIVLLVHEGHRDGYSEYHYPSLKELSKSDTFRAKALENFMSHEDERFVSRLSQWAKFESSECPLHPVDVFFIAKATKEIHFEDDRREASQKRYFKKGETVFVYNHLESDLHGFGKVLKDTETDNACDIVLVEINGSGETEETADRIYKLAPRTICARCNTPVVIEHESELDYPFFCPNCDENMFELETTIVDGQTYQLCLTNAKGMF